MRTEVFENHHFHEDVEQALEHMGECARLEYTRARKSL